MIEKANILAAFVVYNLDVAMEALEELHAAGFGGINLELTEEQIIKTKVEEAACWYRVVDELAYGIIRDRPLFADHFVDKLARALALQGVPPELICRTMAERSKEYAQYREWTTADVNQIAGTLLWRAGKHVGVPVGLERHFMFNMTFGTLFLERVKRALIYQLLRGEEKNE